MKTMKLSDLLSNISELNWRSHIYIPWEEDCNLDTLCVVLGDEEVDEESSISANLKYIFGVHTAQDIVENVLLQKQDASIETLLQALKFYYKNDAFIEL